MDLLSEDDLDVLTFAIARKFTDRHPEISWQCITIIL